MLGNKTFHNIPTDKTYDIEVKSFNDKGNVTEAIIELKSICEDPNVSVIFTSPQDSISTKLLEYIDSNCPDKIGMATNAPVSSWFLNKTNIFSVAPVPEKRFDLVLPLYTIYNFSNVTIFYTNDNYYSAMCDGIDTKKNNIHVINRRIVPPPDDPEHSGLLGYYLQEAVLDNSDTLLLCLESASAIELLKIIQKKKYNFKMIAATPSWVDYFPPTPSENSTYLDYVIIADDFVPYIKLGTDAWFTNAYNFNSIVMERTNKSASPNLFRLLYGYIVVLETVKHAKEMTVSEISYGIQRTNFKTIAGSLSFDPHHISKLDCIAYQLQNGVGHVISPTEFAVANQSVPLPIPSYKDRVYIDNFNDSEFLITTLSLIFIVLAMSGGIATFYYRNNEIISKSNPKFIYGIIFGSILVFIGVIIYRMHQLSVLTCTFRVWTLSLGFIIMFGCLFAKSFVVWRLESRSRFPDPFLVLNDKKLALTIGVLSLLQLLFLIVYTVIGEVKVKIKIVDVFRPIYNEEHCSNNVIGSAMLYLMFIYCIFLMGIGLFLSWKNRRVTSLAYNESNIITFSMYNVATFSIIAFAVIAIDTQIPSITSYAIRSICILLAAFVTVAVSVINKMYWIRQDKVLNCQTDLELEELRKENVVLQDRVIQLMKENIMIKCEKNDFSDKTDSKKINSRSNTSSNRSNAHIESDSDTSDLIFSDSESDSIRSNPQKSKSTSSSSLLSSSPSNAHSSEKTKTSEKSSNTS